MSLFRLVVSSLFVVICALTFNAYAEDANGSASATAPGAAQTAPAAHARHHAAARHRQAIAKIDINSADAATLAKVRGISLKKAEQIIAYRDKNGPFKSLDDLKSVTNAKGQPLFTDKALKRVEARLAVNETQQ